MAVACTKSIEEKGQESKRNEQGVADIDFRDLARAEGRCEDIGGNISDFSGMDCCGSRNFHYEKKYSPMTRFILYGL